MVDVFNCVFDGVSFTACMYLQISPFHKFTHIHIFTRLLAVTARLTGDGNCVLPSFAATPPFFPLPPLVPYFSFGAPLPILLLHNRLQGSVLSWQRQMRSGQPWASWSASDVGAVIVRVISDFSHQQISACVCIPYADWPATRLAWKCVNL